MMIALTTFVLSLLLQPGQSEFVPVTEVPATDQLPAAPLLIAAYAFVWVAVLTYLWLLWRRLGKVEQEIQTLGTRIGKRS